MRGSDPDAALYWLARMLKGGEDPRFLARRITRMAVEDIGLADPAAQRLCLDAWATYERLGSPEGELALAEAVIYLALAPEVERRLPRLRRRDGRRRAHRLARAAEAHPERADPADEGRGLRRAAMSTTTTPNRGFSGQDYFPARDAARELLRPGGPRRSSASCAKGFCHSPPSALGRADRMTP